MKDIVCANNITKLMMSDSDLDFEPSFRLLASFLKITGDILWLSKTQADGIYSW